MFSPKHITGTATADEVLPPGERREWLRELRWLEWVPRASVRKWLIVHFFPRCDQFIRCVCRQRNHQPGLEGKHVN